MNTIFRSALVVAGLAISTQAAAWTVWPDVDFEWYANVGRSVPANEVAPAAREGYIWSPGHWEARGDAQSFVAAHWVKDDYAEQLALHNRAVYATVEPANR